MKRDRFELSVSVFILLIKNNRLCMLRRKATGWMDGFFSVPAGGLEPAETIASAAIREAREEAGVVIHPDNLHLAHTLHSKTEDRSWLGHFFVCTAWEGDPVIMEAEKHGDLSWVNLDALPAETIPYVKQAVDGIRQSRSYSEYGWG